MIPLVFALGCQPSQAADPPQPSGVAVPVIEEIEETTVGDLDGESVPFGNVWEDTYTRADGSTVRALSGMLFVPGGPVRVGAGSVVTVAGHSWSVIEVVKRGEHGVVRLKRAP